MAKHEIDTEDAAVFALFGLSAAASVGIADVQLFSYAFTDVVYNLGGRAITLATLLSAATFGFIYATNEPDLDKLDDEYKYAVIGTAALIVGIPMVPEVYNFVTSNDAIALGAMVVQSAGVVIVSFEA